MMVVTVMMVMVMVVVSGGPAHLPVARPTAIPDSGVGRRGGSKRKSVVRYNIAYIHVVVRSCMHLSK
jgi:hypothetical protein